MNRDSVYHPLEEIKVSDEISNVTFSKREPTMPEINDRVSASEENFFLRHWRQILWKFFCLDSHSVRTLWKGITGFILVWICPWFLIRLLMTTGIIPCYDRGSRVIETEDCNVSALAVGYLFLIYLAFFVAIVVPILMWYGCLAHCKKIVEDIKLQNSNNVQEI
jgi:hypothetical protein